MQFSGLELSAIVKLAVAIAASDGNVAEQEKAAISLELLKFGVDENSVNTLVLGAQAIEYKDALTCARRSMFSQFERQDSVS